jgi:hypothetical protein
MKLRRHNVLVQIVGALLFLTSNVSAYASGGQTSSGKAEKQVPLASVYASSSQDGTLSFPANLNPSLEALRKSLSGAGSSNVFLVRGVTIEKAVVAADKVLSGYAKADPLLLTMKDKDESYWMFVYLGWASSSPPSYTVKGVAAKGSVVRFAYEKNNNAGRIQTADVFQYFYFVPVSQPLSGDFAMELYDAARGRVVLQRTIEVKLPK